MLMNQRPLMSAPSVVYPSAFRLSSSQTIRCFSTNDGLSAESLQNAILKHVEQGDVVTADQALIRLEKEQQNTDNDNMIDLDTYTSVMDAWIKHQQEVEKGGPHQVNQEFQAADRAHAILEKLQRRLLESNENDATVLLRPTQHHYNAVLDAWLKVTRTMLELDTPLRGIPQRAELILQQMQQQAETDASIEPCIHHYNAVMEMWGNSPEHLRATMAENLFQSIPAGVEPDNETYLTLIRAWCRSKQDRAAFNATGHLMKMHRMMNKGEEGVELTMKDYKTILETWTRAG